MSVESPHALRRHLGDCHKEVCAMAKNVTLTGWIWEDRRVEFSQTDFGIVDYRKAIPALLAMVQS